jgi:hypothetical protein
MPWQLCHISRSWLLFFDLVLEWLCTSIWSGSASRMHAAMFLWPILLVPNEVHVVDICRNSGIRLTLLTYCFRYSWSYEVCVWWTAEISRHGAYESLQTCISKMDIRTICELTAISVSLFGSWLQWMYESLVIMYIYMYVCNYPLRFN